MNQGSTSKQWLLTCQAWLGMTSKPNRRLTGGSVQFWAISIVLNNDNRPKPTVNGLLGFEAAP